MKILWLRVNLLDPQKGGGHIRTLSILNQLLARHDLHIVTLVAPGQDDVPHLPAGAKVWVLPVDLGRRARFWKAPGVAAYHSPEVTRFVSELIRTERFDALVCDFPYMADGVAELDRCILFQHNVETVLRYRIAMSAESWSHRLALLTQAVRWYAYERRICRTVRHVWAVSDVDARLMRRMFQISNVSVIGTGVDVDAFRRPADFDVHADFVFCGRLDWSPNIDAIFYFCSEILPLIRVRHPMCTLSIVGYNPVASVRQLGRSQIGITVTASPVDVRPHIWGAKVAVVPLRSGSGTRIKIYEAMAAGVPVVATTLAAEGLPVADTGHLLIADDPRTFADSCISLLSDAGRRRALAAAALEWAEATCSWDVVTAACEVNL
jgi:polysaccharide biosynthesis protein PslH